MCVRAKHRRARVSRSIGSNDTSNSLVPRELCALSYSRRAAGYWLGECYLDCGRLQTQAHANAARAACSPEVPFRGSQRFQSRLRRRWPRSNEPARTTLQNRTQDRHERPVVKPHGRLDVRFRIPLAAKIPEGPRRGERLPLSRRILESSSPCVVEFSRPLPTHSNG